MWQVEEEEHELYITVWNHEVVGGNTFLGMVVVDLRPLFAQVAVKQGREEIEKREERWSCNRRFLIILPSFPSPWVLRVKKQLDFNHTN